MRKFCLLLAVLFVFAMIFFLGKATDAEDLKAKNVKLHTILFFICGGMALLLAFISTFFSKKSEPS